MNAVKAWSYSAWSMYELCPLKYKLAKIDKVPEPGSPAMKRGNDIHVGIANFLKTTSATLPQEALANPVITDLIQQIHAFPSKEVEQQWGYTSTWAPTGWFGKDTWFRSVLDAGVMYDDLTFEITDWKTGKRYGSNDDQMETQAIAVFKRFKPVIHVTTRLAYVDEAGSNPFEFAEFPASHMQRLTDKWEKKVQPMFEATTFPPRPNEKCRFCSFSASKGGQCAFG